MQKNDTDKSDLEKKFNDADKKYLILVGLLKKTAYNDKITEIEGNIPSITGYYCCINCSWKKIPNINNLVKKTDYDAKISGIESKYFTLADCHKFTSQTLDANVKQKEFVDKSAIDGFINNADLNMKVAALTTKAKLKAKLDKIWKLQTFDSNYIHGKSHFEDDWTQNYLAFQPRYFKTMGDTDHIWVRKSKEFSYESIKPLSASNNCLACSLNLFGVRTRVKSDWSCLK